MSDMYEEAYFIKKKIFDYGLNMSESKRYSVEWKYIDSQEKKKVTGTRVSKEGHAGSILGLKKTHHY